MARQNVILFGLDFETTGTVDPYPVQACLVMRQNGTDRVLLNTLVKPRKPIEPEASRVHGITDEAVVHAPDEAVVAWTITTLIRAYTRDVDGTVQQGFFLVTFNGANFDVPLLDSLVPHPLQAHAIPLPHIDVLRFARHYFPEVKGTNGGKTLGELYHIFTNKPLSSAHDAAVDVLGTLELLEAMRIKAGVTIWQLAEEQRRPKPYAVMPIGKYTGTPIDEIPKSWAHFMLDKDLDQDLRATVEYILQR